MKTIRLAVACSLLLLATAPSFALPCESCDAPLFPYCQRDPGSGMRCIYGPDYCELVPAPLCNPFVGRPAPTTILDEWTVASIEITRPEARS